MQEIVKRPLISVITPAFNERENLPLLYERLAAALNPMPADWEWVVIDDHSSDGTFAVLAELCKRDPRVRAFRFSRNSGSHLAAICGLRETAGDCAVMMAADLQDPPETIPLLFEHWRQSAQVVWAVRAVRHGERASTIWFSRLYYWMMRRMVKLESMPATGADFFLLDRAVIDAICQFEEQNISIHSLLIWMGFRQHSITYDKQARAHGASKWTLEKKLKLVVDSVTSFTYLPIRYMSYAGFVVALMGFLYAGLTILNAINGHPVQGWTSLIVVVLVLGGVQMLMLGILGEYLWRALDESRRRPRYLIEGVLGRRPESRPAGEARAAKAG